MSTQLDHWRLQAAHELHDVLGSGIAVIYIQAATALQIMADRPDQVVVALTTIKDVSKQVATEVRAVLDGLSLQEVPAAGLHRVGPLVEDMRRSGLKIDLRVSGERPVPPAVDLAAYRIVQESLTNVLRHAGPAAVIVTLMYGPDALVLEITNTVPGTGHTIGDALCPGGRGLTGMSQRAVELGGTLHAGPLAQGGFRVHARLPATQVRTR